MKRLFQSLQIACYLISCNSIGAPKSTVEEFTPPPTPTPSFTGTTFLSPGSSMASRDY